MYEDLELRNLNDICKRDRFGLYKQWIYDNCNYMRMCNYMQKINYAIQDLNQIIEDLEKFDRRNIVYIITLVGWITDAIRDIKSIIRKDVIARFCFDKQELLKKHHDYYVAIRSFIVAHPLETTRHDKYGFNGDFICVDIRNFSTLFPFAKNQYEMYNVDVNGLNLELRGDEDFYLYCYSEQIDGMEFFQKIGCRYSDIYNVARIYIDKLYALDSFLVKNIKRKDYE